MSLSHIVSKILAGGLTAGVFLLWWPRHFPDTGIEGLVIRGLAWTMSFELLLVTFSRVEDMVVRQVSSRLHPRRERVRARLETTPPRLRNGSAVVMACVALAAPVAMLTEVAQHPLREEPRTKVVREVIVKRPVVKREVVVRKVVAASSSGQVRPDAGLVPAAAPSGRASTSRPAAARSPAGTGRRTSSSGTRSTPVRSAPKTTAREAPAPKQPATADAAVPVSGTATTSPSPSPDER